MNTVLSILSNPYRLQTKLFVNKLMKGKGDKGPHDLLFVISMAVKTELSCNVRKNMGPANCNPVTKIPQKEVYCPCCGDMNNELDLLLPSLPLIDGVSVRRRVGSFAMGLKFKGRMGRVWRPLKQAIDGIKSSI